MTLEKAAEIFDALGYEVERVGSGVVVAYIFKPQVFKSENLGLYNIYFKKEVNEGVEYVYAWSGTLGYKDTVSRCFNCVPLIKLYRDVIEHNMEMLEGAGLKFRMV